MSFESPVGESRRGFPFGGPESKDKFLKPTGVATPSSPPAKPRGRGLRRGPARENVVRRWGCEDVRR